MKWILQKIIGTKNDRDVKKMQPLVEQINALEEEFQTFTEDELKAKTDEFRKRLQDGESIDDILCEAFAVVKNACRRLKGTVVDVAGQDIEWDMVPFDVQLIGGMCLHQGKIAEMATGEGKTLVATMPVYLNALTGKGVHVVTVNDYLARRDAIWMGTVYTYLGLTVGCIQHDMRPEERSAEYRKDITYGTNSEFGFDYLRDNMAYAGEDQVQPKHHYAIIDEIDSILIDEARTPLIISGPAPYEIKQYTELKPAVARLVKKQRDTCNQLVTDARALIETGAEEEAQHKLYQLGQGMPKHKQFMRMLEDPKIRKLYEKVDSMMLTDMHKEEARALREELLFNIDEKGHDAHLTEKGCEILSPHDPEAYVLPDIVEAMSALDGNEALKDEERFEQKQRLQDQFAEKSEKIHAVDQLIKAFCVFEKDVEYVVQENQVIIVDEFTGRLMPGRRWSDGLHQAVEAKEGVKVEQETQTLATITIQNYFRMYEKLAGMTGTAETEADEFMQIYGLDVVVIPTNRPVRRLDLNDQIYKTQREKYNAVVDEVTRCHERKQPVLVGTISVDVSELISRMLKRKNIPHNVLNAKNHEREAEIVMRAGQPGAVTIATNMAGRGTDIKLGQGVVKLARDVIESQQSLDDKIDGRPMKKILEEDPCGLCVIGSSRHESRRIDRQLRGRCARQGDPGASHFFISLEDDLMRLFGSERISSIMEKLGIEEGEVLEHPWLNRSIETAQRRVEQQNFSIRKRTLEYDDVMNKQREVIYSFRSEVLQADELREHLYDVLQEVIFTNAEAVTQGGDEARNDFVQWVDSTFPVGIKVEELPAGKDADAERLTDFVFERVKSAYDLKAGMEDAKNLSRMERQIMLQSVDTHWQEYLRSMDALRQGVSLRAYGQRDPLVEYKKEAYTMFSDLMDKIYDDIAARVFRSATNYEAFTRFLSSLPQKLVHDEVQSLGGSPAPASAMGRSRPGAEMPDGPSVQSGPRGAKQQTVTREAPKVGRNDPCPCGSGRKYKKCCGAGEF